MAGVALALFPLVIKGLSNLVEAVSTVKRFKHYHRELKRNARMIENEWTGFQLSMENLVSCVGHSYEDSQILLRSPGGAAWKDPKLQKQLQAYLDSSYTPFLQTTEELLEDLKLLCEKLNIDSDTQEIQAMDFFRDSVSRFKITFGRAEYKEIFDRIRCANDFLRRTTFQSQASHTWRVQGTSQIRSAGISRLRQQVLDLHVQLARRETWSCSCRDRHLLNFHLSKLDDCLETSHSEAVKFEVALGTANCDNISWPWSDVVDWKMVKVKCGARNNATETCDRYELLAGHKRAAKVKFKIGTTTSESEQKHTDPTIVSNLCAAIQASGLAIDLQDVYLGQLKMGDAAQLEHELFQVPWPWSRGKAMQPVSELLAKLARADHVQQSAAIFPRRSRLIVAAQLALSVLVLDGSWLGEHWTSYDIVLIRNARQSISATGTLRDEDALVLPWTLQEKVAVPNASYAKANDSTRSDVRCAALFALGLILIELSLGARIEDLAEDRDENPVETVRRRKIAFRLLPRVEEQDGEEYANVVERCLDCPFDVARRDLSFDNATFRELVYESIVKPLKNHAAVFTRG